MIVYIPLGLWHLGHHLNQRVPLNIKWIQLGQQQQCDDNCATNVDSITINMGQSEGIKKKSILMFTGEETFQ